MLNDIINSIKNAANDTSNIGTKILLSLAIVLVAWGLVKIMRKVLHRYISHERAYFITQRVIFWLITLVAVIAVGRVWLNALNILVITVAIIVALTALAMKDLVLNLVGFGFIEFKKPLSIGDRILIDGTYGDVHDVSLLHFSVMEVGGEGGPLHTRTQTGRIVYIPNRTIFEKPLINETKDFPLVWLDIQLPISHESNLRKAKMILLDVAQKHMDMLIADTDDDDIAQWADNQEMFDEDSSPSVTTDIDGSGVTLTLRFLSRYDQVGQTKSRIWEAIHGRISHVDDIRYSPDTLEVMKVNPS